MTLTVEPLVRVTADYVLQAQDEGIIDSSERSKPMAYVHGRGELLPGLEQALAGKSIGDCVQVTLGPEAAFGPHRPELVFEAVRDNLPPDMVIEPGMTLTPGGQRGRFALKVLELTEKGALLDGNHPYAGKTLTWDLTITHLADHSPPTAAEADHEPIRWVQID